VKLELRAITNRPLKRESAVMMSSPMPSLKYSCSGSPPQIDDQPAVREVFRFRAHTDRVGVLLPYRLEHTSIAYAHPIASVVMIESEKRQNVAPIRRAEVISDRRSAFFGNEFASEMTCKSHNLAQPHAHDPQFSKGQSEKTRPPDPRRERPS
jgi:hypothetical protein